LRLAAPGRGEKRGTKHGSFKPELSRRFQSRACLAETHLVSEDRALSLNEKIHCLFLVLKQHLVKTRKKTIARVLVVGHSLLEYVGHHTTYAIVFFNDFYDDGKNNKVKSSKTEKSLGETPRNIVL
jgi:hypothetical protein